MTVINVFQNMFSRFLPIILEMLLRHKLNLIDHNI